MAVTELLRLIVDADTRGAVRGIEKLGATAKKELSKSEQAAQKWGNSLTKIGAGMVAVGAIGVVGLARAAKASEEAHLSVVKLENTLQNMPQLAGESSEQFIDLADSIQDVTAADADQIVAAEAMLGTFRLTADEIKDITPLVVDYARKFGVDLVSAATQVGKALDGNVGALKRNGVSIDEAAFAADRYSAVQAALSEQVGGFAEEEGKTFAGSVQRMKNELGDLAEGVGSGAVDAFSSMFGVIDGVTDRLNEMSPATQNAIGKFATFASVGLIAAGGLSVLIGQAVKMHQNFGIARDAVSSFAGKLGGLRSAAAMAAGIAGVAGIALAIDQMERSASQSNIDDLARQFLATGEAADIASGLMSDNMDRFKEAFGAFGQLVETDRQAAQQLIESAEAAGVSADVIGHMKNVLEEYSSAQDRAGIATQESTGAISDFGGTMQEQAEGTEEAISALQDYNDTMQAMTDPVFAAMDALNGVRDAQVAVGDAQRAVLEAQTALNTAVSEHGRGSAEAAEAALALEDAERGLTDAQWGTVQSAAQADQALAGLTDAAQKGDVSIDAFEDTLAQWVAQGFLTQQQADNASDAVHGLADEARDADRERVAIPVSAPGSVESRTRLRNVRDAAHSIPSRRSTTVSVSGVGFAIGQLDNLARRINSISGANVRVSVGGGGGLILHEGGIVPGPRGQEVAAVLQAGERVMSLQEVDAANRRGGVGFGGGGSVVNVAIDLRGAVVPSSVELDQIVHKAVNRGVRQGGIQLTAGGTRVEVRR